MDDRNRPSPPPLNAALLRVVDEIESMIFFNSPRQKQACIVAIIGMLFWLNCKR